MIILCKQSVLAVVCYYKISGIYYYKLFNVSTSAHTLVTVFSRTGSFLFIYATTHHFDEGSNVKTRYKEYIDGTGKKKVI
jgi:hypothetical protein